MVWVLDAEPDILLGKLHVGRYIFLAGLGEAVFLGCIVSWCDGQELVCKEPGIKLAWEQRETDELLKACADPIPSVYLGKGNGTPL